MMNQHQKVYFFAGLAFVLLGFLSKTFYRPFAVSSGINDLGFSDSAPSLFYVAGFSLMLSVYHGFKPDLVAVVVTIASIGYEFFQASSTLNSDLPDILYSLIGGVLALFLNRILRA